MRFVILFVLTSSPRLLCDNVTTEAPAGDLVDILKENLRRNNDDYIDSTILVSVKVPNPYLVDTTEPAPTNDTKSNKTLSGQGTFHYGREPNKLFIDTKKNPPVNRRKFDSFETNSDEVKHFTNKPKVFYPLNKTQKTTFNVTKTLPRITTSKVLNLLRVNNSRLNGAPNFRSSLKKEHQIEKMHKIKNFISKNKQMFQDFIQKKKMESQAGAENNVQLRVRPQNEVHLAQRSRPAGPSTSIRPELLDMAPARGGQIHALRVRGHLCYRHVLIPEGPKYDSRGHQYLDPYGHADGRNYSRTRRPHFVLPRCCNCCRKSVLGCE